MNLHRFKKLNQTGVIIRMNAGKTDRFTLFSGPASSVQSKLKVIARFVANFDLDHALFKTVDPELKLMIMREPTQP